MSRLTIGKEESGQDWLDLEGIAAVEVTSEDPAFPIVSALRPAAPGWRAAEPGEQRIRIVFDEPKSLEHIHLRFDETEFERTQQFVLRWWPAGGGPARDIVRQQYNFSPAGATTEIEEYTVRLEAVSALELAIQPAIGRRDAIASLTAMRLR